MAHRLVHYPDYDQIFSVKFEKKPSEIPSSLETASDEYQILAPTILFEGTNNAVVKERGEGDSKTHEWDMISQGTSVTAHSADARTLRADGRAIYKFRLERTISEGSEVSRQY